MSNSLAQAIYVLIGRGPERPLMFNRNPLSQMIRQRRRPPAQCVASITGTTLIDGHANYCAAERHRGHSLDDALDLDVTGRSTALKQLPDEEVNCVCARHS